jgi:hypothetical protein
MATKKVMRRFVKGIILRGAVDADIASDAQNGALFNSQATSRIKTYIQGAVREVITADQAQELTFKTLTNPTIDAAAGVIIVPQSAAPAQTTQGSLVQDSVTEELTVGDGVSRKTLVDKTTAQEVTNKAITFPSALHVKQGTTAALVAYAATQPSGSNGQFCFATDTKTMYQIVDGLVITLAGPASGENNTGSNVGTGEGVFKQKAVFDLEFKTLKASGAITINSTADEITFGYVAPAAVASLATPQVSFSSSPQTLTNGQDGTMFSVDALVPITVNLPASPTAGIRYVIKCKTGKCATNNITVVRDAAHTIENLAANYILEANYGSWIFVFDGVSNWTLI